MLNRFKQGLVATVVFLVVASCYSAPGPTPAAELNPTPAPALRTKNVVILVLDGPRQSEMWADEDHEHIPNLWNKLRPRGTLFNEFRNNGFTLTNPGHAAMTTGVYENLNNSGKELPSARGIFQYFLASSGLPKSKAWVISTKDKLAILADTRDPDWKGKDSPSVWSGKGGKGLGSGYGEDAETFKAIKEIFLRDEPRLVLINFKEPDAGGHSGDWKKYLAGMRSSDGLALDLYEFLESLPAYQGQTAILITHDHGRHLDGVENGFMDHGDTCEGCRSVALLAIGPDFKADTVISGGELIDIPPTVAKLLGFNMPPGKGRVLTEAMK